MMMIKECITRCWVTQDTTLFLCMLLLLLTHVTAQVEGDTGYDYHDNYDMEYEDLLGTEPVFDVMLVNVTVVSGQTAVLPCSIDNLGKHKVAWMDENDLVLTYEDRRVVDDYRFSVMRPYYKEWNLQIQDVTREDHGNYKCRVNTDPVKTKLIILNVKVPPMIIAELSTNDVTVQEGDTVVLVCNVTGVPRPEVTWYRRPASSRISEREKIAGGEILRIKYESRIVDDIYECVADNGVPPSISRQIRVRVEFAPEISIPYTRISQSRGKTTIIECVITSYPQALNYWEKDGVRISNTHGKFRIEAYDEGEHTITLSLTITDIQPEDYGEYHCVATNSLGSVTGSAQLYELGYPTSSSAAVEPTTSVHQSNVELTSGSVILDIDKLLMLVFVSIWCWSTGIIEQL